MANLGLPSVRDITYTPASSADAAMLNKAQDVVNGRRHRSQEMPLAAARFQQVAGGNATLGSGQWTTTGAAQLLAGLRPFNRLGDMVGIIGAAGEVIKTIDFELNRGGAGTITLALYRSGVSITSTTVNTGTGVTKVSLTCNAEFDAGDMMIASVSLDNVAQVFYRAAAHIELLE